MKQMTQLCVLSLFLVFGLETVFAQNVAKPLFCYWGAWSVDRAYPGNFTLNNFDAKLCSHLIVAFAHISEEGAIVDIVNKQRYREAIAEKADNPNLKVLLAIGGADPTGIVNRNFAKVVADDSLRNYFVGQCLYYCTSEGFDGIDLDWEYPEPGDRDNFMKLLQALHAKFHPGDPNQPQYILTSAMGCGPDPLLKPAEGYGYDLPTMANYLDYFLLMAYDLALYSNGNPEIGHHAPIGYHPDEISDYRKNTSVKWIVERYTEWTKKPEKLVLGVGTYGHTYALASRDKHNFYDHGVGPGQAGEITVTEGSWAYSELCLEVPKSTSIWEFHRDEFYGIPYAFNDNTWIGFDDEESARKKTEHVLDNKLGGVMVWSIDQDDCNNLCQGWYTCPVISAIRRRLDEAAL